MNRTLLAAALLLSTSTAFAKAPAPPAAPDARTTIENFYRAYLPLASSEKKKPELKFSKAFRALRAKDAKACKQHADGDVCGWGADADPYLDSQDIDPTLTFENSKIAVVETAPGTIDVKLNISPGEKENPKEGDREIVFAMVREDGAWKVDDLVMNGQSARKQMDDEIQMLTRPAPAKQAQRASPGD